MQTEYIFSSIKLNLAFILDFTSPEIKLSSLFHFVCNFISGDVKSKMKAKFVSNSRSALRSIRSIKLQNLKGYTDPACIFENAKAC